jgi:hypothetical protein
MIATTAGALIVLDFLKNIEISLVFLVWWSRTEPDQDQAGPDKKKVRSMDGLRDTAPEEDIESADCRLPGL